VLDWALLAYPYSTTLSYQNCNSSCKTSLYVYCLCALLLMLKLVDTRLETLTWLVDIPLIVGRIPLRQLVYRVLDLPPSMRPLVYDFGQLTNRREEDYTRQIVTDHVGLHFAMMSLWCHLPVMAYIVMGLQFTTIPYYAYYATRIKTLQIWRDIGITDSIQLLPAYLSTLKICRVELCTKLLCAIIPTLFLCFLLICYPYSSLHS